jgi:uncharacterized protein (DUF58 family)
LKQLKFIKKYIGDLFLGPNFYYLACLSALLFIVAFFEPFIFALAAFFLLLLIFFTAVDYFMLFVLANMPKAIRKVAARLSNGDKNLVQLFIRNRNRFSVVIKIIDELPFQLQERNFLLHKKFAPAQQHVLHYSVLPTQRGSYSFGNIILFMQSALGLVVRRFTIPALQTVSVYPSYMQMKKFQLISTSTTNNEPGNQRKRKIGQSMEFEQIKDYVTGDDIRTINWKATARRGMIMVNNYVDEKSQQVFCMIDKGRLMKMPFNKMSLLDYSINATLALSNVCLQKQDRIGLVTFSNKAGTLIPAERKPVQRELILQALFKEQTDFLESDFEMLYMQIRQKIKQRSLVILFTNFESVSGLRRQIGYLRSIARHHLLLVVFFENTELQKLSQEEALTVEDVYIKTVAEKFVYEKKMLVKELKHYGILSVLTSPENLTVNTINKYLELKASQAV